MSTEMQTGSASETTHSSITGAVTLRRGEQAVAASAARAKAEVEARFTIALHRPRNILDVRRKILDACKRPGFAQAAFYAKPVGGTTIRGFSIRFAEEIVRALGNITVESPVIWEDDERRTVRITVTDLENNASYSKDVSLSKTVERRNVRAGQNVISQRQNTSGQTVFLIECSEDEMAIKVAAAESKIIRNAGLRLVPSDILDEAEQQVELTLQGKGGTDPKEETKRVVDAFATINVSVPELEKYLGHALDTVSKKQITELRAVFTAIKDGEASWRDYVGGSSEQPTQPKKAEAPKGAPSAAPAQPAATAPVTVDKTPPRQSPAEKLVKLRELISASGIAESAVLVQLRAQGILDESLDLDQAIEVDPGVISVALSGWKTIEKAIKTGGSA